MLIQPLIFRRFSTAFAVTSLLSPVTPLTRQPPVATPSRVQTEIVQIRAESAATRDELRKLEERDRMLLLLVQGLQRGGTASDRISGLSPGGWCPSCTGRPKKRGCLCIRN
jgi:hypothetical protein